MKKLITIIITAAAILCGCQTRITAEKHAEQLLPYYGTNGTNTYIRGYERASGGWYATARSPLWADEELKGLTISVETNGTVRLGLDAYSRDLSTNAVTMAHNLVADFGTLAEKVSAAYATVVSGGASTAATSALEKLIASFISQGGNASNASVTCMDGNCTITDGTVCVGGACNP